MAKQLQALRNFLCNVDEGPVVDDDRRQLLNLLRNAWSELQGSTITRMGARKLNRMEDPHWKHPELQFLIERHGATKLGSTRAEIQRWRVNVEEGTARCGTAGHRQVRPTAPPYTDKHADEQAEELIKAMENVCEHEAIERKGPQIKIHLKKVPRLGRFAAAKETIANRRSKLKYTLLVALRDHPCFSERSSHTIPIFTDEEFRVDINSADKELLQYIDYVGPTTAEQIIDGRPWESLGALTVISGITKTRVEQMKEQGIATVD